MMNIVRFLFRTTGIAGLGLALIGTPSATAAEKHGSDREARLRVFFVDVEGGQATLFVAPGGESLLIDTGWPGHNGRDADRIVAVAKQAGLKKIDYVLLTHYHDDHVGGVPQLVARIPVGTFIDHGPNRETNDDVTQHGYAAYQALLANGSSKRMLARPGDVLPIIGMGMKVTVISADGELISRPLAGGGTPNEFCGSSETRPADKTENGRSLGVEITFGRLKLLDLGDLTWDKEMELMCPSKRIGNVDVYIVSHHGWYQSSSPALVDAIHPRIAVMDNGETKGGSTPTLRTISSSPGLETLWQLHYSAEGGEQNNSQAEYIANPLGTDDGYYLELRGAKDGSFEMFNARTKAVKDYPAPVR